MRLFTTAISLTLLSFLSGCATSSFRDSWSSATASLSRFGKNDDSILKSDAVQTKLTPEFKSAQRKLKDAESMLLAHARLLEDQEKFAEARQRYRELITAYPKSVNAAVGLARIELKTGRVEQAEAILQELRQEHPRSVPVRLALGGLYAERGEMQKAVETYSTAVDLDPDNQTLRYELGVALARANQVEQALPHLKFAVGESAATYNIGYLLYETGRTEEAKRWFNAALEGHPDEQTRMQASKMIAQLSPPPAAERDTPDIRTASATQRPISTDQWNQQQPSVTSSSTTRVVPATHSNPVTQDSRRDSVFSTASQSVPLTSNALPATTETGQSRSGSGEIPQWQGKNAVSTSFEVVAPEQQQTPEIHGTDSSVQQPPMWRSRNR